MSGGNILRTCTSLVSTWPNTADKAYLFVSQGATAAVVVNAGSGYAVNDTITLAGGTGTVATVLTVASLVPATSTIATVTVTTAGRYSVPPTGAVAQASSSGPGVNATFTVTYARMWMTSSTPPTGLLETFRMTRPGPYKTYGLFMRNLFTRTAGSGTWSASMSTKSIISVAAAPSTELLTWTGAPNLGSNAGGVVIISGNTAIGSNTTALNLATVGSAGVTTGDERGGYIGFSHSLYSQDFAPFQDLACWFLLEPNAAPGSGNTWTITTDIWEVYTH